MKKLVRHAVFETNSSSSHAIAIPQTMELLDTIRPDKKGRIVLRGGEFGTWKDGSPFTDALTKANYLAVWAKEYTNDSESAMSTLNGVLRMQTGANEIIYEFATYNDNDDSDVAYIDHQSSDHDYFVELFSKPTLMMNFLFNPRASLHIKSDGRDYLEDEPGYIIMQS
jgi:hypothetical protein